MYNIWFVSKMDGFVEMVAVTEGQTLCSVLFSLACTVVFCVVVYEGGGGGEWGGRGRQFVIIVSV